MDPLAVEGRLTAVSGAVVRCEVPRGHLLGQLQHRVEGLPRVLGEPVPLGQQLDVEPLVQHEVQVASGQQQ